MSIPYLGDGGGETCVLFMSHNLKNLVTNNPTSRFMKTIKLSFCLLLATLVPRFVFADLTGPYTVDANTLYLFHFDEAAGGTLATNVGSKGGVSYSVNENPASATPPTVTTMLGAAGFVSGAANFQNCMTNPTSGFVFGYDFNNSGAYEGDVNNATPSADRLAMTNLNIGKGGQTPFTLEALIRPTTTGGSQEIICTDRRARALDYATRGLILSLSPTFQLHY